MGVLQQRQRGRITTTMNTTFFSENNMLNIFSLSNVSGRGRGGSIFLENCEKAFLVWIVRLLKFRGRGHLTPKIIQPSKSRIRGWTFLNKLFSRKKLYLHRKLRKSISGRGKFSQICSFTGDFLQN